MSKKEQHIKVPQLRFPEFLNGGEWIEKKLGDCLLSHPEYGINAAAVPYSENLPTYLRITDISEDGRYLSEQKVSVAKEVTDEDYLEQGDIVFARTGASVGKSYKYREEDGRLVFAGFLIRVRPDKSKLLSELLYQFLSSDSYWKWVAFTSQRSGQPGINGNEFASLLIPVPESKAEQQKIADCLSSLDDLIAAEREKLDALKAHKKGLMQELFPAEGETVPMRRFPEFEGEWSETILEDNYNLLSGQHLNPDEYSTIERNQYPYFSGPSDFTNDLNSVTKWAIVEGKRALRGSILITVKGSGVGASMLLSLTEVVIGRQLMAISSNTASVPFLFHQIGNWTGYYQALAAGNMIPGLSRVDILRSPIKIPSMAEQEKISAVLTAVDERITAQAEKIDQLKIHKKGLMQQLFPSEL